jgi:hypothetical protein
MKKGVPWASPRFDACTSWIFIGMTWASPSLNFCPYFSSSHHSPFPTLENFLHTKLHTILISNISVCKIVDPPWFSFNSSTTLINTLATVATSLKSSVIKRTQKERDQEANANSGRNLSKQNSW